MTLPAEAARFVTHVGLRDGSKSTGVRVSVDVNGNQQAAHMLRPGAWQLLEVDLARWAGNRALEGRVVGTWKNGRRVFG